jgi:hypothetical protein
MQTMYYIGLDVHKRTISYCLKDSSGKIHADGTIPATRFDLDRVVEAFEVNSRLGRIAECLTPNSTCSITALIRMGVHSRLRAYTLPNRPA